MLLCAAEIKWLLFQGGRKEKMLMLFALCIVLSILAVNMLYFWAGEGVAIPAEPEKMDIFRE
jgi:uncharacterized membrane protein YjdF